MEYKISGDNLQLVTIQIEPGEKIYAEAGSMVYMSSNINMEAKMRGGLLKGIGRKFAGETMFLTEFTSVGGTGLVSFGGNAPGTIKPVELTPGKEFLVQKDAFLCAEDSVDMSIAFQRRLGAAFFGGEGFILEKLAGQGTAFIHACGDFVEFDLKEEQVLKVDTGSVVGWDHTVTYDIERVKGIKTMFFGGEGLFLTTLRGPGRVILQSMSLSNLATALAPFLPQQRGGTSGSTGGIAGTLLRETLGR
ncbi:TIGR00266 family protein [Euryarchaeota archaeon ex4484_162]|nr:MAG: TIGR00266 family protein [Euryarchaeota archaeon ex4484_162]RLF28973.1 MAG: TIGR00266 family protein [Thermoplasmata archaeon]